MLTMHELGNLKRFKEGFEPVTKRLTIVLDLNYLFIYVYIHTYTNNIHFITSALQLFLDFSTPKKIAHNNIVNAEFLQCNGCRIKDCHNLVLKVKFT